MNKQSADMFDVNVLWEDESKWWSQHQHSKKQIHVDDCILMLHDKWILHRWHTSNQLHPLYTALNIKLTLPLHSHSRKSCNYSQKTYANYKFWLLIVWVCLCSNHVTGAKIHIIRFWQRQLEIETECKKAIRCHPRSSILRQVERKREYIQQFWSIWKCSEVIATHNCKSSFSNRTVIWPRSLDNPCEYPEKLDIDWN